MIKTETMKIKVKLVSEIEIDIFPDLEHWENATTEEQKQYVLDRIEEGFTLEDLLLLDNITIIEQKTIDTLNSLSEEDIIAFNEWVVSPSEEDSGQPNAVYISQGGFYWHKHEKYTPKELLDLWKSQQPKIIYYE
jgi:hypothetical protein